MTMYVYVLPFVVSVLCYINSLHGDLVHDDIWAVKTNPDVLGHSSLFEMLFRHDYWGQPIDHAKSHKSYRPLTVYTFRLNFLMHGFQPFGYHVVNVCLHAVVSSLLSYICLTVLGLSRHGCLFVGLLFATHPVHTEAVAGVVGRADVLATLLALLSFLAYNRSLDTSSMHRRHDTVPGTRSWPLFMTSMCLAGAAMLAKETGITVVGVSVIYDIIVVSGAQIRRLILKKILAETTKYRELMKRISVALIVMACCLAYRLCIMGATLPQFIEQDNPTAFATDLLTRFLTYAYLYWFNVCLLLFPTNLSYDWQAGSIPLITEWTDCRNLPTAFILIVLLAMSWRAVIPHDKERARRSQKITIAGLLFLVITFLPASNLLFSVGFVVAERVLYLPSVGFCILVSHGMVVLKQRLGSRCTTYVNPALFMFLTLLATKTLCRNTSWSNRELLFRSGLVSAPQNAKVHYNYANLQRDLRNREIARHHYQTALHLWPNYPSVCNNLGTLEENDTEAERHYRHALRLDVRHTRAKVNLASLLIQRGDKIEALRLAQDAANEEPSYNDAKLLLASLLAGSGQTEQGNHHQAINLYMDVLNTDPVSEHMGAILGSVHSLSQLGRTEEAVLMMRRAVAVQPSHELRLELARLYISLNQMSEALHLYKQLMDENVAMHVLVEYAQALGHAGKLTEAESVIGSILKMSPDAVSRVEALHTLANVYGQLHKHEQAISILDQVLSTVNQTHGYKQHAAILFKKASHLRDLQQYTMSLQAYSESLSHDNN